MSAQLDRLAASPEVLKALQLTTLSSLGVLTGVASALYAWVIPIIQQAPDARTKVAQFETTIIKGGTYLQPTSRVLAASLTALTVLSYRNPDPLVASRWRYYALALGLLIPAAPWEIIKIFPINDILIAKGKKFEKEGGDAGKGKDEEVDELLRRWRRLHLGRIVAPGAAFLVGLWTVISEQRL